MRGPLIRMGLVFVFSAGLWAQQHDHGSMSMPMPGDSEAQPAAADANEQMSHHHLDMGPHMKTTATRPATQADKDSAALTVASTRESLDKYKDYKVAIADGY